MHSPSRHVLLTLTTVGLGLLLSACAAPSAPANGGWVKLIDGTTGLDNFNRVGSANWVAQDGAVQASSGGKEAGYLVTKASYKDVMIRAEFWSSDDANSGVFFRCQDPSKITDENCYEANIFDQRPDPIYGTGAIVKVAKAPSPMPKAGGQWNTYEITAQGKRLTLVLNGVKTVDMEDGKLADGPIALQWGKGVIKWRKVEVKAL
jgi:hypothetical protein